ncbi:hypothetical protein N9L52_08695 [Litoricolaceae bacterium]|nr:hypothetical protein [Litorivicinaceae bacterium]
MRSRNYYIYQPRKNGPYHFVRKINGIFERFSLNTKDLQVARTRRDRYLKTKSLEQNPESVYNAVQKEIEALILNGSYERADTLTLALTELLENFEASGSDLGPLLNHIHGKIIVSPQSVDSFLNNFMIHLSSGTRAEYRTYLLRLENVEITQFSARQARELVDALVTKYSGDTLVKMLSCYRTFWNRLGADGSIWDGHRVRTRSPSRSARSIVTHEQYKLALTKISGMTNEAHIRSYLEIARWTGCRRGVIGLIKIHDAKNYLIVVPKAKTEAKDRIIQVSPHAWPWVEHLITNRPSDSCLKKGLFKHLGIDLHSFRHTVSSICENCPPVATKRYLGHKIRDLTFDRYGGKLHNTDFTPIISALEKYWID